MAIEFVCPSCRGTLRVGDDAAGRVVRCAHCMSTLKVPPPRAGGPPDDHPPADLDPRDPDDHGEPRPRRRRRPLPAARRPGRGVLFWVLVVFVVLAFLTVLLCGGALLLLQPKWRPHQSDEGRFRVEFPADVQPNLGDQPGIAPQAGARVEGTVLPLYLEIYAVYYSDLDADARRPADDDLLREAVKRLKEDTPDATAVRETPITADGQPPAREVAFQHADGGTSVCRVVVAGDRLYVLAVHGPWVTANGNDRTRRFFESFRLTDAPKGPRPKGGNPFRGPPPPPPKDEDD